MYLIIIDILFCELNEWMEENLTIKYHPICWLNARKTNVVDGLTTTQTTTTQTTTTNTNTTTIIS